jgi:hypothetical protein
MKQKCKSLFCALLCLVLMCATVLPVWAATTAPAFGTDVSQHNGKGVDCMGRTDGSICQSIGSRSRNRHSGTHQHQRQQKR